MEMDSQHFTLWDLCEINGLTVRAYTVCLSAKLLNLHAILCYYKEYGSFLRLRNCGRKTDSELIAICKKYYSKLEISKLDVEIMPKDIRSKPLYDISFKDIQHLSSRKERVIQYFLKYQLSRVKKQEYTLISSYLKYDFSLESLCHKIFQEKYKPSALVGISKAKAEMVDLLFNEIYNFIREVLLKNDDVQLCKQLLEYKILNSDYRLERVACETICNRIDMLPNFTLFKLMEELLANQIVITTRELDIFNQTVGCYVDFHKTILDTIGQRIGLSRERIRQIRNTASEKMNNLCVYLREIPSEFVARYGIDGSAACIPINEEFVQSVNHIDGTRFNAEFIGKVLGHVLADKYVLYGCSTDLFDTSPIYKGSYMWRNLYLVDYRYEPEFDFQDLVQELSDISHLRRRELYVFNLKDYVLENLLNSDILLLDEIVAVAKQLVWHELNLSTNSDGDIVFEPNSRLLSDCIYDLLLEVNQPTAISWIEREIKLRYPEVKVGVATFYKTCKNDSRFILWGIGPIYGLRAWKDEANIKEGRILDMVEEYLQAFDEPKHIDSITSYVCRFRNTSKNSIRCNVSRDKAGRFRFFGKLFIGLTAKVYPSLKQDYALSAQ